MGIIIICWVLMALMVLWALVVINWNAIVAVLPVVGCLLVVALLIRLVVSMTREKPFVPASTQDGEPQSSEGWRWDRVYTTEYGMVVEELGDPEAVRLPSEVADEVVKLRLALAEARAVAEALQGPAVAIIRGRAYEWRGESLVLAVVDAGDHWQRVIVKVTDQDDRQTIGLGMGVEVACRWTGGRLTVERVLSVKDDTSPLPELPEPTTAKGLVPDWFSNAKNEKRELLKAADGSSSVSDLRIHIVFATKRRGKVLNAAMVERIKSLVAEVIEAKCLGRLLAVNGEDDHCHIALWLPVNLSPSEAAGLIKSYVSRHLRREFRELTAHDRESLWQRGFYAGAIGNGGDLAAVLDYIKHQQKVPDENPEDSHPSDESGAA